MLGDRIFHDAVYMVSEIYEPPSWYISRYATEYRQRNRKLLWDQQNTYIFIVYIIRISFNILNRKFSNISIK